MSDWLEDEVKRHSQKIEQLDQFSSRVSVNIESLIKHQEALSKSFLGHTERIDLLEQSDVRRDERARLMSQIWKYLVALFIVGLIMGAIIGDVHLLKEVFGR